MVVVIVAFVLGRCYDTQVGRARRKGIVRHVYAHYVIGERGDGMRVGGGARRRVRSRRSALYTQPAYPRTETHVSLVSVL